MIIEIVIINLVRKLFFFLFEKKNNEVNTLSLDIGLIVSGKKGSFQYCIIVMMKK